MHEELNRPSCAAIEPPRETPDMETIGQRLSAEATLVAYAMQETQPAQSALIAKLANIVDQLLESRTALRSALSEAQQNTKAAKKLCEYTVRALHDSQRDGDESKRSAYRTGFLDAARDGAAPRTYERLSAEADGKANHYVKSASPSSTGGEPAMADNKFSVGQVCDFMSSSWPQVDPRRCTIRQIGRWGDFTYQVEFMDRGSPLNVLESELTPTLSPGSEAPSVSRPSTGQVEP